MSAAAARNAAAKLRDLMEGRAEKLCIPSTYERDGESKRMVATYAGAPGLRHIVGTRNGDRYRHDLLPGREYREDDAGRMLDDLDALARGEEPGPH